MRMAYANSSAATKMISLGIALNAAILIRRPPITMYSQQATQPGVVRGKFQTGFEMPLSLLADRRHAAKRNHAYNAALDSPDR